MTNDIPIDGRAQLARKYSNVIELKLDGGRSVQLAADQDTLRQLMLDGFPEADWSSDLNIISRDLAVFTGSGQWNAPAFKPTGDPLKDLLDEYAVALIGGKNRVVRWRKERLPNGSRRDALDMISKHDFSGFHSDKMTEVSIKTQKGQSVQLVPASDQFFRDAKRYDGLVYLPHEGPEVDGAMNLWRGFGLMPKQGSWARMQEHIHEVLTSGNYAQTIYLVKWCAWAVQNPGLAAEVAVLLKEREGAGKGGFVQALLRMFGIHGLHISGRKHLTGNFNKHLMYCSLLYGDEVFWGGDLKEVADLKRLITEPTLTIEPKTVDAFSMPNCLHIIMASNEDWAVPAGPDARRFAVMDVSSKRIGDRDYFDKLWAEIEGGGTAAMLYDLLSMDLQGWHPRQGVPQTDGLMQQKLESLKGVDRLVYHLANEGKLQCLATQSRPNAVVTTGEGDGIGFISWAKRLVPSLKHMQGPKIKQALVADYGCCADQSNGKRILIFPRLEDLRKAFEKRFGHAVKWENPDLTDWEKAPERGAGWKAFE
jgi:hypothetical protein